MNNSHIVFLARGIIYAWGHRQRFNMPVMKGWELSLLLNELRILDDKMNNDFDGNVIHKPGGI